MLKSKQTIFFSFAVLMFALGANDSMRGVFSFIFTEHFSLNANGLSNIVTISYIGNLLFLAIGGNVIDRMNTKYAFQMFIIIWILSQLLFLLTDSYSYLLCGMFVAMGTSTLLNTTINISTPTIFEKSPAFLVNLLFFIQGIGTSLSQSVIGNIAVDFNSWHKVNLGLIIIGLIPFILSFFMSFGNKTKKEKISVKNKIFSDDFIIMVIMMGCYFIAEHGVLNWLVMYITNGLNLTANIANTYTSIFFGLITIGRLVLGAFVDKIGVLKSLRYFSLIAAIMFFTGVIGGEKTLILLSLSGFMFSIIYPTLVMLISRLWDINIATSMSGIIISIASLADIAFNALFGNIADILGYKNAFMIMPIFMIVYSLIMFIFSKKKHWN